MSDQADVCGVCIHIYDDHSPGHWAVLCNQEPDHKGPHVGSVSWGDEERLPDE